MFSVHAKSVDANSVDLHGTPSAWNISGPIPTIFPQKMNHAPDQILNFTRMFDDNNVTSGDIVRPQNADFIVVWMRDSEFSGKNVNEAVRSNRLGFHGTQLWGRFFKMGKLSDEGWYVSGCFLQGNAIDHEHHFVCKKNGSFVKKRNALRCPASENH